MREIMVLESQEERERKSRRQADCEAGGKKARNGSSKTSCDEPIAEPSGMDVYCRGEGGGEREDT